MPQGIQDSFRVARGNEGLLLRHCREKLPHLVFRGESRGFSRVVVRNLAFFSSCDRDIREHLLLPQGNQVSFRVAMGIAGLHSSHCRDIGPHLEFSHKTQGYSPVATRYSGFLSRFNSGVLPRLLLMHGIPHSSRVINWVSGLLLS